VLTAGRRWLVRNVQVRIRACKDSTDRPLKKILTIFMFARDEPNGVSRMVIRTLLAW
jgi:hypothetical protein